MWNLTNCIYQGGRSNEHSQAGSTELDMDDGNHRDLKFQGLMNFMPKPNSMERN